MNAALALATVECLQEKIPVSLEQAQTGLAAVRWPGRLQVERIGGRRWIFDGAHNPAGVVALADALQEMFPDQRFALLFGCLEDKQVSQMAPPLISLSWRIQLVRVRSERSKDPLELKQIFLEAGARCPVASFDHLPEAIAALPPGESVLVTGSLHFLGETMELCGLLPGKGSEERGLNDWKIP